MSTGTRPAATGRIETQDGDRVVVLERHFRAGIEDVWAAVTESERMARWIGTWTGDPASGSVQFLMTAEGDDVAAVRYDVVRCDPPRSYAVHADDGGVWDLAVDLTEDADGTLLRLTQVVHDPSTLPDVGPGWDYYLDRLVVAESGGDVATVDWDAYYPSLREHYVL